MFFFISFIPLLVTAGGAVANNIVPAENIQATASSYWDPDQHRFPIESTYDGRGLTGDLHSYGQVGTLWLNSGNADNTNYQSGTVAGYCWIGYEFDAVFELDEMWLWNGNIYPVTRGLKNVTIQYSTDGLGWSTLGGSGNQYVFDIASGADNYAHDYAGTGSNEIDFNGVDAKYVVLTAHNTWGDAWAGLSEVRFYGTTWSAVGPAPSDGEQDMELDVVLSWTAGKEASSHDVYFGTTPTPTTAEFKINKADTTYEPNDLEPNTTYYWRIDGVNDINTWTGSVWNFTTRSGKAIDPNPDDGAQYIGPTITLSWTSGAGAFSHDVYFGTNPIPVEFKGNFSEPNYDPGALETNTTYYWCVDELDSVGQLLEAGDVWRFTTIDTKAFNSNAACEMNDVSLTAMLRWSAGGYADSHDVYFGTDFGGVQNAGRPVSDLDLSGQVNWADLLVLADQWLQNPEGLEPSADLDDNNNVNFADLGIMGSDWMECMVFKGNQDANSYVAGGLELGTTYYWRVDEISDTHGDSPWKGEVWSFTFWPALYTKPELGPTRLVLYKELDAGYYTLRAKFATDTWRRDFIFRVDHQETAFHTGYFTHSGQAEPPTYRFDFVISESGRHRIELNCEFPTYPVHNRALRILDLEIEQRPAPVVPDLYATGHPGQYYCHGWGWMPSSTYQRYFNWKITYDYWKKRIVDGPAKWGSNYLQLFPEAKPSYLQDVDIVEAINYAHKAGFLVDEHAHGGILVGTSLEDRFERLDLHMSQYFDRLEIPAVNSVDGWETEQYGSAGYCLGTKENVITSNQITWKYHPGSTIADCKSETGEHNNYLQWLHEDFHGPNYYKILMCAGGWAVSGYDDMDAMSLFPNDLGFKNEYNWVFRTYQADARPYTNNIFGGTSSTDWMAKECWDFFRLHAYALREGRLPINSALNWLGEPTFNLPEDMREAAYALSMDPCRSALVYLLATTGRDGLHSWRKYYYKQNGYVVPYRPRDWAPSSTMRLHNGILAADQTGFGDIRRLIWDSENLGQFDLNAKTVQLARSLFETRLVEPPPVAEHTFSAGAIENQVWDVAVPAGSYEILASTAGTESFRAEIYLMGQYLGSLVGGPQGAGNRFACYISDDDSHPIELELADGEEIPAVTIQLVPTDYNVPLIARLGSLDDSSAEFADSVGMSHSPPRFSCSLTEVSAGQFPEGLAANSADLPRALDMYFDGYIGNYLLAVRARTASSQLVEVTLNSQHYSYYDDSGMWVDTPGYYNQVGGFITDSDWQTFQVPIVCPHRSGRRRFKIELSVPDGAEDVEFDTIALYKAPVCQHLVVPGGHKAILDESFIIENGGVHLDEQRELWMVADEPTVYMNIERQLTGGPASVLSLLDFSGYEQVTFDGQVQDSDGSSSAVPDCIKLCDNEEALPPVTIYLLEKDNLDQIDWSGGYLELSGQVDGQQNLKLAATLRDANLTASAAYFQAEVEEVNLAGQCVTFTNNDSFTKVHLVKVNDPEKGPYFVEEKGWWSVRGAQRLYSSEQDWEDYLADYDYWIVNKGSGPMPAPAYNADLVRLVIPAGEQVKLQAYGFIDGIVRPGWGSHKQMLIKDVEPNSCTVEVLTVDVYAFAPRIEFSDEFTSAKLDGQPWAYHDHQHVFLPQQPGTYHVEVIGQGQSYPPPTLTCTSASVTSAVYSDNELTVTIELPQHVFQLPEGLNYNLAIGFDPIAYEVNSVTGGTLVREGTLGAIVTCEQDTVSVSFDPLDIHRARNPNPPDGANDVNPVVTLSWDSGIDVFYHDVFLGTNPQPGQSEFEVATEEPNYTPDALEPNTIYYWCINGRDAYVVLLSTGDVWSFTTRVAKAINPRPVNGADDVDPMTRLGWESIYNMVSHDVYLGTNPSPGPNEYIGNVNECSYEPGILEAYTAYYWRIDEVNDSNVVQWLGDVWSFTTGDHRLIGWWKFDDGDGNATADSSVYGHNGIITGAEWVAVGGSFGYALDFEGNDCVSISPEALWSIDRQVTVTLWQYGDLGVPPQSNIIFYSADSNNLTMLNCHLAYGDGGIVWDAGNDGNEHNRDRISKTSTDPNEYKGRWNHWAFTKNVDTGIMKMYLNGSLWHSGSGKYLPLGTAGTLVVGGLNATTSNYDGMIADVRIYNRELGADDINDIYQEGL